MANPFPALVAWLDENCRSGGTIAVLRTEPESDRLDWASHLSVVRLLEEAEAFVRAGEDWELHEPVFRNAAMLVFQPNARWMQEGPHNSEMLPELRRAFALLGRLYEHESGIGSTPALTEAALNTLRESLQEIRAGLTVIPMEFQEDRKHLERIIDVCLELLDADAVDHDLVRSRVNETIGEAIAIAEKLPEDVKPTFVARLRTLSVTVNRYVADAAAQGLIGEIAAGAARLALTGGA